MNILSTLGLFLCLVQAESYVLGRNIQHGRPDSRPGTIEASGTTRANTVRLEANRRELCVQLASGISIAFLPATAAVASGGATAGGAYLLSVRHDRFIAC
jgi:hypothetical protein